MKEFPKNVFPDVERNAFKKHSKKNVTEDYIKENLRLRGWDCYAPFTDTGLDLIATKEINCQTIYRYIQIKTRSFEKNNHIGFTLKSKDFETDCRKFFFIYCDSVDDILIISMYDFLKLCLDNYPIGATIFGAPGFRNGNNKINGLQCTKSNTKDAPNLWTWNYDPMDEHQGGRIDLSPYLNLNGLEKMTSTSLEDDLETFNNQIAEMKFKLFYQFRDTNLTHALFESDDASQVSDYLSERLRISSRDYISEMKELKNTFLDNNPALYLSHKQYLTSDTLGGTQND